MTEPKLRSYKDNINDFIRECKGLQGQLVHFKNSVKSMVPIKESELSYYKTLADQLKTYEETNLTTYASGERIERKLIVGDSSKMDVYQTLVNLTEDVENPFKTIRNWVKGELMDIQAMLDAINKMDNLSMIKLKLINKIKENNSTIEKINSGKFTIKGFLTKKSDQGTLMQKMMD